MLCNRRRDAFSDCHPVIGFLYFAAVIFISVFMDHPLVLGISFLGALTYSLCLRGWRRVVRTDLLIMLPAMIIIALLNPVFSHYGVTFLFYLKTGPVTLEAVVYGAVLAWIVFASILWFGCFNDVMTTDKFVYLFGRLAPALSLVLSMVFRFVPRFGEQIKIIRDGQKAAGRDAANGSLLRRIRYGINILSILITWALENAIETSDSMRARGYGLKGRTSFSLFRFDGRDMKVSAVLCVLMGVFTAGAVSGTFHAGYDPMIDISWPVSPAGLTAYAAWAVLCFFPVILRICESWRFRVLRGKAVTGQRVPWYMVKEEEHIR